MPFRTASRSVTPSRRLTYAELDRRANRLAHQLAAAGVRAGDHVGLHLNNGTEYVECMLALFKLRAVPVNVNYRYVERELEYLYRSMDLVAVLAHREFVPVVATVAPRVPTLRHVSVVDDGSTERVPPEWPSYEDWLAEGSPERSFTGRSSDDIYCACTGGTTGLPKGVMWRHEDIFFASMGGGDVRGTRGPITEPEQLRERIDPQPMTMLLLPPLMHVSSQWGAFMMLYSGATAVFLAPGPFDAAAAWRAIETERVNTVALVGNAMARPLIDYYAAHSPDASIPVRRSRPEARSSLLRRRPAYMRSCPTSWWPTASGPRRPASPVAS